MNYPGAFNGFLVAIILLVKINAFNLNVKVLFK